MDTKTSKQGASTSEAPVRSARSKAKTTDQPVRTQAFSGMIQRSGRLTLGQLGLSFAIAVMVVCSLVLTVALSAQIGLLDKLPFTTQYQASQAMTRTMPLVVIGYLSRENGGPMFLMQDRVTGCQYFKPEQGALFPRIRENGTQFCEPPDRQVRQAG